MRRILIIAILLAIPLGSVLAFEMKAWEEVFVNEMVDGDLYTAWWRVEINSDISWDLFIAGWDIIIDSNIWEDLTVAWWQINISWNIGDDLRIAWWSILINWDIWWDLIIWWWEIRIREWVKIGWDIVIWAWKLVLDWNIKWNALISVWDLVLNWNIDWNTKLYIDKFTNPNTTWSINWNLDYKASKQNVELENIASWTSNFKEIIIDKKIKKGLIWFVTTYIIIKLFWLFLFSLLFYFLFKKIFKRVSTILRTQTSQSFLYWILTILLTPIIIVLLLISVIWIPFAFLLLFIYIFLFVFLGLLNTIVISSLIISKYKVSANYQKVLIILWFTIIFWLTNWLNLIVWLFTIWAVLINKKEIVQSLR